MNKARPKPRILFLAGFGDGAEMFSNLHDTGLADQFHLMPVDFPGFAGVPPLEGETTLSTLAEHVEAIARREDAHTIVAHSVASIIASLAASNEGSPIHTVISLEGNLTKDDAYFSGTAADYPDPDTFKEAFLERLDEMAKENPIIARYRQIAGKADSDALWQLGCDARRFSDTNVPGRCSVK